MSTRVEKGAAKFKPILKAKLRPSTVPVSTDDRPKQSNVDFLSPPSAISLRAASLIPTYSDEALSSISLNDEFQTSSTPPKVATSVQPDRSKHLLEHPISQTPASQIIPIRIARPFLHNKTHTVSPPSQASLSSVAQEITSPKSLLSTSLQLPSAISTAEETLVECASIKSSWDGPQRLKLPTPQARMELVKKDPPKRTRSRKTCDDGRMENDNDPESLQDFQKKRAVDLIENDENEEDPQSSQSGRPRAKRKKSGSAQNKEHDESSDSSPVKRPRYKKGDHSLEGTPDPIDPTQVTMNSICIDTGSGRVSSRWESSQTLYTEAKKRAREEREQAIAETEAKEHETGRLSGRRTARPEVGRKSENGEVNLVKSTDDFSYDESLKASHYAPQVRIGANGEVVLDVESLQVDRSADPDLVEEYNHIEETDHSRFTNSNSWSKRRIARWTKEDTALFYDALRQFGQNFDLIARVLPGRTYRMCKNKFKAEDKKNPALIDDALRNRVSVDLATLARMTGKDFTGPTPVIEARKPITLVEDVVSQAEAPEQIGDPVEGAQATISNRESSSPPPPECLMHTHVSRPLETE